MNCAACPKPLGERNVSGFCRSCYPKNRPEGHGELVRAGIRKMYAEKPASLAAAKRRAKELSAQPDIVSRRTRKFIENRTWEVGKASQTPQDRERAIRSIKAQRLEWCPPDLRDMYLDLRKKGVQRDVAMVAVLDHERVQLERLRRRMENN